MWMLAGLAGVALCLFRATKPDEPIEVDINNPHKLGFPDNGRGLNMLDWTALATHWEKDYGRYGLPRWKAHINGKIKYTYVDPFSSATRPGEMH